MRNQTKLLAIAGFSILVMIVAGCSSSLSLEDSGMLVASVDLERYAGLWYQVGRYPNSFQRGTCAVSTAEYTLDEDGKILVLNRCWEDFYGGKYTQQVRAVGRPADDSGSRLLVTFFKLFTANYLVVELDQENYQWAAVTTPNRGNLWILSRTPALEEASYQRIIQALDGKGFNPDKIIRTSLQALAPPSP
jgi:apolipoprotein D and lipocalin family protein